MNGTSHPSSRATAAARSSSVDRSRRSNTPEARAAALVYAITGLPAVMLAAAVLYTVRLNGVPPSLSTDETAFALQAHAIATTAHDTNGRLLPLYFQMVENVWFHPALVYAMAPVLGVLRPLPWVV